MNEDRIEQLETAMIVAGGRAAATQNRLDDEQAGAYQIEGRLLEPRVGEQEVQEAEAVFHVLGRAAQLKEQAALDRPAAESELLAGQQVADVGRRVAARRGRPPLERE